MDRFSYGMLVALLTLFVLVTAVSASAGEPAYHWYVDANGTRGSLDLSTGAGGRISGTLLGSPVEGWLVGRRLVLFRQGADGRETWEAWLATPESVDGDGEPILAGTFYRKGDDGPLPWFGTPQPIETEAHVTPAPPVAPAATRPGQPAGSPPAVPPGQQSFPAPVVPSPSTRPSPAGTPPASRTTIAPRLPSGKPSLAGTWETPDGPLSIRQEGSKLTFVLPDREVPGRLTGPDSLIGGFGPGCCKGHLEQAFTVIVWDNGVRWYRK